MDKSKYVLDVQVEAPNEEEAINKAIRYLAEKAQKFKNRGEAPSEQKEVGNPPPKAYTLKEMKEALSSVFDVFGKAEALNILNKFGVEKYVRDVPLEKAEEFIDECQRRFTP